VVDVEFMGAFEMRSDKYSTDSERSNQRHQQNPFGMRRRTPMDGQVDFHPQLEQYGAFVFIDGHTISQGLFPTRAEATQAIADALNTPSTTF
jgi:hypothetical protein